MPYKDPERKRPWEREHREQLCDSCQMKLHLRLRHTPENQSY